MARPLERLFDVSQEAGSAPKTLVAETYRRLRAEIIHGTLKPGTKLRAEHLKIEYQVGGATIREALALLVADALVVSREQRGFTVAPVSIADFTDITATRALTEAEAVRLSVRLGDDEWEGNLSSAYRKLTLAEQRRGRVDDDPDQLEACNKHFHEVLIEACGSRWLRHFVSILYRQSERYRRLARFNEPSDRDVGGEHASIFEAAIRRDAEAAATLVERHIRATLDVIKQMGDAGFGQVSDQ